MAEQNPKLSQIDTPDSPDSPDTSEKSVEDPQRGKRQRDITTAICGKSTFSDQHLNALLDYAESCSKEEFEKMLNGDIATGAPSLHANVMEEQLWNLEVNTNERRYTGFRNALKEKVRSNDRIDRRVLMAELAWESELKNIAKITPNFLKGDLKRYYGTFDRNRAATKHGLTDKKNPIPDCSAIIEKMHRGFMQRMDMEYAMVVEKYFEPKQTAKLIKDMRADTKTPEAKVKAYNEIVKDFGPQEVEWNKKRQALSEENPTAYALFLKNYEPKNNDKKEFKNRETVMTAAIEQVDKALDRLAKTAKNSNLGQINLTDPKKFKRIEDIESKIKEIEDSQLSPNKIQEKEGNEAQNITQSDISALEKEVEAKLYANSEFQKRTIHETILRDSAKAQEVSDHQDEATNRKRRSAQISKIKRQFVKNEAEATQQRNSEKESNQEKFTELDTIENTFNISLETNSAWAGDEQQVRNIGEMMRDTEGDRERDGLYIGKVINDRGSEADKNSKITKANTLNKELADMQQEAIKEAAKNKGWGAKVIGLFERKKENAQDRKRRIKGVLNNIDKYKAS